MVQRVIVHHRILAAVKAVFAKTQQDFTIPSLIKQLEEHYKSNELYTKFTLDKLPDKTTFEAAFQTEGQPNSGANQKITLLLCDYGQLFKPTDKNRTLDTIYTQLKTTRAKEIKKSEVLKSNYGTKKENIAISLNHIETFLISMNENISSRFNQLSETLQASKNVNVVDHQLTQAIESLKQSTVSHDVSKMQTSLKEIVERYSDRIKAEVFIQSYFACEYMKQLIGTQKFEEAVLIGSEIRKHNPNNIQINYHIAISLFFSGRFKDAIDILLSILELEPFEAETVLTLIRAYSHVGDLRSACSWSERAIERYKKGELFRNIDLVDFSTLKVNVQKTVVDEHFYRTIVWEYTTYLTQLDSKPDKVASLLLELIASGEDEYFHRANLLRLPNSADIIKYCTYCRKLMPEDTFFLIQLIFAQMQEKESIEIILENIRTLRLLNPKQVDRLLTHRIFQSIQSHPELQHILKG